MVFAPVRSATVEGASFSRRGAAYFGMSGPAECAAAASLFAIMIVLRIVNIIGYRFDADESQHLHVIWGWAHGLVQYRDLFDNHMPLFQIMLAPIFGLIGDRASDLCLMRFALLPMYFVAAWCIYRIGTLHTTQQSRGPPTTTIGVPHGLSMRVSSPKGWTSLSHLL
jgi:hypothetical protein